MQGVHGSEVGVVFAQDDHRTDGSVLPRGLRDVGGAHAGMSWRGGGEEAGEYERTGVYAARDVGAEESLQWGEGEVEGGLWREESVGEEDFVLRLQCSSGDSPRLYSWGFGSVSPSRLEE